ncbi:YfiT family bacillithiol transferase [Alicyclobacillus ferrooxydans]|uniref:Metal-dependent hydrolase n=1 Tax=Alicyclobacillus ferrooxydans TaxID=471514 RepID=A0A0P9EUJ2_9BACL|nr:putative metal-dependent hydrolase [Alicyclobacillus ferrooxydans]KPV42632.1 metal-dependent hydrolase [Alicyclobacillus ferrooxydans]
MDLSYPIGRPQIPEVIDDAVIQSWIHDVLASPDALKAAVAGLTTDQLDTPYRPDGWTVRQVVHHLADTHMHTYTNFKHALTEDNPVIKPIDINAFAALPDSTAGEIEMSLLMFEGIQRRWAFLMKSMSPSDLERTFEHPRAGKRPLSAILGVYAWHAKHHTAHITGLRERMGW